MGAITFWALLAYLVLRLGDMAVRGQFAGAFSGRFGVLLATAGIVFNRINVVLFAMTLKGSMPQVSPETYAPTLVEWGLSIGLIALTIFLFELGERLMPVLPKEPTELGH